MFYDNKIWIGESNGERVCIEAKMANRHGLIAGATGTGKIITLKAMLQYVSENSAELAADYGNIAKQSAAAILRNVVALEAAGVEEFFGEHF